MKSLKIVDEAGNGVDYNTGHVPRIGERIMLVHGIGGQPVKPHYYRVKDVEYRLQNDPEHQVGVLVEEEHDAKLWPE
jgi:hypothetical protein